jgi:hypothetical protein
MGWFSDLLCGKISPFYEIEKKLKNILSQITFINKYFKEK